MIDLEKANRYNNGVKLTGAQITKLTTLWQKMYGLEPLDGMCGPVTLQSIDAAGVSQVDPVSGEVCVLQVTDTSFIVTIDEKGGAVT